MEEICQDESRPTSWEEENPVASASPVVAQLRFHSHNLVATMEYLIHQQMRWVEEQDKDKKMALKPYPAWVDVVPFPRGSI